LIGYRAKPPRGFGRNVLSEHELASLLDYVTAVST
jgi:hypothetical protein